MPTTREPIYKRLTHRYRDGFRHLDGRAHVATLRLTSPTVVEPAKGFDDGGVIAQTARIPAGLTRHQREELAMAVESTLGGTECQHEHDCCGCAIYSVTATTTGRRLRVVTRVGYNF